MSCIVAIEENGTVYMGAETAATSEDGSRRPIMCDKMVVNGSYVFGFTGSVRAGQVLRPHTFTPPTEFNLIGEAIRVLFNEMQLTTEGEVGAQCATNLIIGYNGHIYEMLMDFQVNQSLYDFTTVGSGAPYAFGSLYSCADMGLTPEERITLALDAAVEFDSSCKYPTIIRNFSW